MALPIAGADTAEYRRNQPEFVLEMDLNSIAAVAAASFILGLIGGVVLHRTGWLAQLRAKLSEMPSWSDRFENAKAGMLSAYPPQGTIAIVGDSLVELGPWTSLLGLPVANYGVGGNSTSDVLTRLDTVANSGARRVFIVAGVNDLCKGISLSETIANYTEIIKKAGPNPVVFAVFTGERGLVSRVNEMNDRLRALCDGRRCTFVDLPQLLAEDGVLQEQYTWDGSHLTPAGYRVWGEAFRKHLPHP